MQDRERSFRIGVGMRGRGDRRERRERRKGRMARLGARARSRPWAVLLVANMFPIAAAVFIIHGYRTGKISFLKGAEGVIPSLVLLVLALGALIFLTWIAAPLLMPAVAAVRDFIRRQSHAIARGGIAGVFTRFPALVAGLIIYAFLWINVILLASMVVANVLAILACLALFAWEVMRVWG